MLVQAMQPTQSVTTALVMVLTAPVMELSFRAAAAPQKGLTNARQRKARAFELQCARGHHVCTKRLVRRRSDPVGISHAATFAGQAEGVRSGDRTSTQSPAANANEPKGTRAKEPPARIGSLLAAPPPPPRRLSDRNSADHAPDDVAATVQREPATANEPALRQRPARRASAASTANGRPECASSELAPSNQQHARHQVRRRTQPGSTPDVSTR